VALDVEAMKLSSERRFDRTTFAWRHFESLPGMGPGYAHVVTCAKIHSRNDDRLHGCGTLKGAYVQEGRASKPSPLRSGKVLEKWEEQKNVDKVAK
jgi:hypothetical protein